MSAPSHVEHLDTSCDGRVVPTQRLGGAQRRAGTGDTEKNPQVAPVSGRPLAHFADHFSTRLIRRYDETRYVGHQPNTIEVKMAYSIEVTTPWYRLGPTHVMTVSTPAFGRTRRTDFLCACAILQLLACRRFPSPWAGSHDGCILDRRTPAVGGHNAGKGR